MRLFTSDDEQGNTMTVTEPKPTRRRKPLTDTPALRLVPDMDVIDDMIQVNLREREILLKLKAVAEKKIEAQKAAADDSRRAG